MKMPNFAFSVLALILLTTAVFIPAYFFHNEQKNDKIQLYFKSKIAQERMKFEAAERSYTLVSKNIFNNIINKEEIISIINQANRIDDHKETAHLRDELYQKLQPLYLNLKTQDIRQLHFQLQGNSSFLRFHRPKQFGDSLVGVRYSIDKVNLKHESVHGFEEGRILDGFRNVYPLMHRKKLAGTVEISYSFNAIKNQLKVAYPAYYSFLIKKEVISAKVFKEELKNYVPTALSPLYMQDKESIDKGTREFNRELVMSINNNIKEDASQLLTQGQDFLLDTIVNQKHFIIIFTAITNVENKKVAYYIVYQEDKILEQIQNDFKSQLIISIVLALIFALLVVSYVRLQRKATRDLEVLATTDALTQIANRHKFNVVMDILMHRAQRYDLPLSIIFFDIDDFKALNDKLGHETGDEILVELSALINGLIRSSDLLARWGGEEFIIVLPETNHAQAMALAEKLRLIIETHTFVITAKLTCSFGVTQLKKDDDETSLLKRVDTALYSAKESGKNRVIELN